jgi:ABC-type sugar transport system substrate-binding protein
MIRTVQRLGRRARYPLAAALAGIAILSALLSACTTPSASSAAGSSAAQSSGASAAANSGASAAAKETVALAGAKLLYGPTTGPVTQSELRAPRESDIRAFPYKPAATGKKVVIVSCSAISPQCVHTATLISEYLAKLQIKSVIFNADYTPAGNQAAVDSALAQNPNAIILLAVAPSTIGPEIAQAHARHIYVVDGIGTAQTDGGNLDAYVPQGSNLYQVAVAAELAVAGNGKTNVHWLTAPAYPELEVAAGTAYLKEACPGCTLTQGTETAAQVTDPVQMGQLATSIMRSNPNTNYLTLASACADLQAASSALQQLQQGHLAAGGCGASAIAAMNARNLAFATGSVEPWSALADIDQTLRLMSGKQPLPESEVGPAAYLLTPQNTPYHSSTIDYGALDRWAVGLFNFVAPYSKAWGVDLSSVISNEK